MTGSVASVSGKSVSSTPVANVAQALQGKLPGVNVISQDGRPDAAISIRVRGGGSISQSNEPLILVDGVTVSSINDIPSDQVESVDVLKDASSTAIYGARGANGVILITTKNAKSGKVRVTYNGYAKFNTPIKYLDALDPYDYLTYVWAYSTANGNAYRTPFEKLYGLGDYGGNNVGGIENYRNVKSDNVQKEVYKISFSHNHDLSIMGGSEKTRFLFTVNYIDEQGMKINSYSKRANVSLKVDQKILKNLSLSLNTRYVDVSAMGNESTTTSRGSILSSSYRFRPIAMADILGDLGALREGNIEQYGKISQWEQYSPQNRIKDYEPLTLNQLLRSTISLNWDIIKGLVYHTDFTLERKWGQMKYWSGSIFNNYLDDATGDKLWSGAVDYKKSDNWNMRWTNTLNYSHLFSSKHLVNILLGHEVANSGGSYMRIQANHFPANFSKDNAFAMINQYDRTSGSSQFFSNIDTPDRILSLFSRINYTLLDRYLLTLTFRADGSSKFSPEHRWGLFPAAALAWRLSEESFMKSISWLDNLKLRLSYGEVGNDGISSDLWLQTWSSTTDRRDQYVIGDQYIPSYKHTSSSMANQNLKWETTVTRDIGIDFSLFKNRLTGTIDFYWNTTKDLLMLTTISGITGFTSTYDNIGQTSNRGLEIALQGIIFQNKDWNVSTGFNINLNKGKVDKLADNVTGLYGTGWASAGTFPSNDYILKVGKPVGQVRGLVYDGFYTTADFIYNNGQYSLKEGIPDVGNIIGPIHGVNSNERPSGQIAYPGVVKYKDLNNDGLIDDKDVTVIGDMTPKHTGGFNVQATFKGFDLGMYFNWSYGNKVYNLNKLATLYGSKEAAVYENKLSIIKNTYKIYDLKDGNIVRLNTPEQLDAVNSKSSLPLAYNENGITSSLGIEDGSFLRLNTLTLGYTVPASMIRKIEGSILRVYGTVYNVFTITKYSGLDPEVNANPSQYSIYPTIGLDWGTYPRSRSFVFGINLSF